MPEETIRASIVMPVSLRRRIASLGKTEGRVFMQQALKLLEKATSDAERKVQSPPRSG